jgi:hypothetical protein
MTTAVAALLANTDFLYSYWNSRVSAGDSYWVGACYGNGTFVAVAEDGIFLMTSPDGVVWTAQTPAAACAWESVCFGNGLFVAVTGANGASSVMTSPDGVHWTLQTAFSSAWTSVCYGNGLYVAVSHTYQTNNIMTSPNGINWTRQNVPGSSVQLSSVCYGNGTFVAVSSYNSGTAHQVLTSTNGVNWTIQTTDNVNTWCTVAYGGGVFVATSPSGAANGIMRSVDNGVTWASLPTPGTNNNTFFALAYGNGCFIGVTNESASTEPYIIKSPDGLHWYSMLGMLVKNHWQALAYGAGMFAAFSTTGTGNRVMTTGCIGLAP